MKIKREKILIAVVVVVLAWLCLLEARSPAVVETLRHMYCTANEAQAIECTAKGWW